MVGLSKVKDIYLIRQRRITQQQTCIRSHEFITRSASASTDCIISHRDVYPFNIQQYIYTSSFFHLLLFFILIQRWWYALSYLSVFLLVVFRFSFFFFVLFDLSNIRWTKTVKKASGRTGCNIHTQQQQQQKALYLRESRWRSSIYIYILCVCSVSALFCLCPISIEAIGDRGTCWICDSCWTVYIARTTI